MYAKRRTVAYLAACAATVVSLGGCSSHVHDPHPTTSAPAVFAGTPTEYNQAVARCLKTAGYDVEMGTSSAPGGGPEILAPRYSSKQLKAFSTQVTTCEQSLPPRPEVQTDAQLHEFYDHWITHWQCLVDAGFDPGTKPSYQSFAETYRAGNLESDPAGLVPQQDFDRAQKACPPDPDAWW